MSASSPTVASALAGLNEFRMALTALDAQIGRAQVDGRSLQQSFLTAQQCFQQHLLPTLAALPAATACLPVQTEMNRTLRLLGIDVSFLQSAQHPLTVQKRQVQMRQRLQQLQDFSQVLQTALTKITAPAGQDAESEQLE